MSVAERLSELGLVLPPPTRPVANYVPANRAGDLLFVSGQLPLHDGRLSVTGTVGADVTPEQAYVAAREAALNALAVANGALEGGLDAIQRVARVTVYVNAVPDFTQQSQVANGASDLLVDVLGDAGRHARSAIGVASLPLGSPVEVELTLHVR